MAKVGIFFLTKEDYENKEVLEMHFLNPVEKLQEITVKAETNDQRYYGSIRIMGL